MQRLIVRFEKRLRHFTGKKPSKLHYSTPVRRPSYRPVLGIVFLLIFEPAQALVLQEVVGEVSQSEHSSQEELVRLDELTKRGDLTEAKHLSNLLLAQAPDDPFLLLWAGYLRMRSGLYHEALLYLEKAEQSARLLPNLAKYLAMCYRALGRHSDFERQMHQALRLRPDDAELYYLLGQHYGAAYDPAQAISFFSRALELQPEHYQALYYRGYSYELSGDKEKARKDFLESIELAQTAGKTNFSLPWLAMARLSLEQGSLEEALSWGIKAAALEPDSSENWLLIGKIRSKSGDRQGAREAFEKTLEIDASNAGAWYSLYRIHLQTGEKRKARRALDEFTRLTQGHSNSEQMDPSRR